MPADTKAHKRSYAGYLGFVDKEGGPPVKPANTGAPALTGTAKVGEVLTVTNGTWTGVPDPLFTRIWFADGVRIVGATGLAYTVTDAEIGKKIKVSVVAESLAGAASKTSTETAAVTKVPVNTALPVITGTAKKGEELTTTDGEWDGAPAPTFTYAWQRSETPISGATSDTYTLVDDDVSEVITVKVTATNSAGATVAESEPTEEVIA